MDNYKVYGNTAVNKNINFNTIKMTDEGNANSSRSAALLNIWSEAIDSLLNESTSLGFSTFIKAVSPYDIEDNFFVVVADDNPAKQTIERRYSQIIEKALCEVSGRNFLLRVLSPEELEVSNTKRVDADEQGFNKNISQSADNENHSEFTAAGIRRHIKRAERSPSDIGGNLKEQYIFENFIKGNSNEFAYSAALSVADGPGETTFNPLFIYGGVGLGKTHLMHSIGNYVLKNSPNLKVLYTTSETLTNEFITSIRTHKNEQFRNKYRSVDLLMVDDIQFLSDKEGTQAEIFHTFNTLYFADKQIVVSSDRPPKDLKTLEDRLRTRFGSGLVVDITTPDFETRAAILENKAEKEHIIIPRDVIQLIAQSISSNIRELEGALNKVIARARLTNKKITMELAETTLRDMVEDEVTRKITPELILEIVSSYFNVTVDEIKSTKRPAKLVKARFVSMFLMRKILDESLNNVAKIHGNRHHSTALNAIAEVEKNCLSSEDFRDSLVELESRIRGK